MVKAIDSEMLAVPNPSINVPPTAFPCCASVVVADCAPPTGSFVAPMYSPETTSVEADGKAVEPPEHPTRASPAVAHNAQNLTGKQAISKHLPHPLSELNSRELRPHSRADGRSRAILFSARVASLPVRPPTFRQDARPRPTPFAVRRYRSSSDTKRRESNALSSTHFFSWLGLTVVENGFGFVDVVGFGVECHDDVSRVEIFLNSLDGFVRC